MMDMEFSAEMIAQFLSGELVGDPAAKVNNFAKIEEATQGCITFLSNMKYEQFIYTTGASVVIVDKTFEPKSPIAATLIKVDSAYGALSTLLDMYVETKPRKKGVAAQCAINEDVKLPEQCYVGEFTVIESGVELGENISIYPQCYIGNDVKIGANVTIYSGVKIYEGCVIGDNCVIHSGAVIGADGFGFAPNAEGIYKKIHQIGNVILEDNVEIGSNTTIDRATMGSTIIRNGVKLDNLIQIGHNVVVGDNTVMAAQVGIAGSTKIGKGCMFGGQVGIAGHIEIADSTLIGSQSGIHSNVTKPNTQLLGYPALDVKQMARIMAVQAKLPDMYRQLSKLEREFEKLKK